MTARRRRELTELIREEFARSRGTYGCRRLAAALRRRGITVSVGLVALLMRESGLETCQPRAYKRTTIAGEDAHPVSDRIGGAFTAERPGARLAGDITYIHTGEGWLYLATVIDLCTRMVVGWSMADHLRTELVTAALQMAKDHGKLEPDAIFHSDRGTQYTSHAFAAFCADTNIIRSVGATGVCFDNALAESFFGSLKNKLVHRYSYSTRRHARFAVAEYIEVFYNRQRLHSALGYITPAEAEAAYNEHPTAA